MGGNNSLSNGGYIRGRAAKKVWERSRPPNATIILRDRIIDEIPPRHPLHSPKPIDKLSIRGAFGGRGSSQKERCHYRRLLLYLFSLREEAGGKRAFQSLFKVWNGKKKLCLEFTLETVRRLDRGSFQGYNRSRGKEVRAWIEAQRSAAPR